MNVPNATELYTLNGKFYVTYTLTQLENRITRKKYSVDSTWEVQGSRNPPKVMGKVNPGKYPFLRWGNAKKMSPCIMD